MTYNGSEYTGYYEIKALADTYPMLFDNINNYIKELNTSRKRIQSRTAIINAGNVLLERYMRRMMHPSKLRRPL